MPGEVGADLEVDAITTTAPDATDAPTAVAGAAEAGAAEAGAGAADRRWTRERFSRSWSGRSIPGRHSRLGRVLLHEWTLAILGGFALAVLLTWPTMAHPFKTIPQDIGDPTLQAWQVAWTGHALLHDLPHLWSANSHYPEPLSLAFSDSLLGYSPAGLIGSGVEWALFRYNVLFVFAHALAFIGAYFLVRQLGSGRFGGIVAGLAFGFAPWRLSHAGHLNVLSTGGIALALALLARGHDWKLFRPGKARERTFRPGWALCGWLVAAWQVSLGFGLGVPFGYVLGGLGAVAAVVYGLSWLRRRQALPRKLLIMDAVGIAFFGAVTLLMAIPYLRVVERMPYTRRSEDNVAQFSVPFRGLFTAPETNRLWGESHAAAREKLSSWPEMAMLPGIFLICLAVAGLFFSVWRVRDRILLAVGVAFTVVLVMGSEFGEDGDPGYLTLYHLLPGWDAMRTPGRIVVWTTLLLGVLAAGFLTKIGRLARKLRTEKRGSAGREASAVLAALAIVSVGLVFAESRNTMDHPEPWTPPAAMRNLVAPAMFLPPEGILENDIQLWSTDGFPKLVNGSSGISPKSQEQTRDRSRSFPDAESVAYLRSIGVRSVVWLAGFAPGSDWQDAPNKPIDGLGITKENVGDDVVFHLD